MKKKILINVILISTILVMTINVFAKSVESFEYELEAIKSKLESNQSKLTGLEREINAILVEVVELDKEIEKSTKLVKSVEEKSEKAQKELENYQEELKESEKEKDEVNIQLEIRLRQVYENGSIRKRDLFFNSKSLKEYISKYTIIMDILDYDRKQYTGQKNKEKRKKEIKQGIDKKNIELGLLKEDVKKKQNELLVKKQNREKYIEKLKSDQNMLSTQNAMLVKQEEELSNDLTNEIQKLIDERRKESNIMPSAPNAQGFVWPFPAGGVVTAGFPNYPASFGGGRHDGFDIALAGATQKQLVAAKAGIVLKAVSDRPQNTYPYAMTYGNHVIILHDDGVTTTLYGHMERVDVVVGQRVETGQVIGLLGNSGYSTGPHVHFEVRISGVPKNPQDYVSR